MLKPHPASPKGRGKTAVTLPFGEMPAGQRGTFIKIIE